jgi:2-succinyl-5-enolpyruvyl-6-hydroxy-3-cyclohexene-1-carboxylate synthase
MTTPNRNVLWAEAIVDELVAAGTDTVCVAPGSRSTPLTVAAYQHPELTISSHLDERSGAYFALGRARRTGRPAPLICTSGTAAANFHPAVIEADQARVPMVVLTADRPPELRDSGANQTIDQEKLYGDAVRFYRDLAEPEPDARKLRSLRTTAARAITAATTTPAGPVHLNVPFRKPLEPIEVEDDVPEEFTTNASLAASGRGGAFVETAAGERTPPQSVVASLATDLADARRPLFIAGPADPPATDAASHEELAESVTRLADLVDAPLLADPLSGLRFGSHVGSDAVVCGGYDGYLGQRAATAWRAPDIVVRIGASPTSNALRTYLAAVDTRQILVDPAAGWREAEFTASERVTAHPTPTATALAERVAIEASDPPSETSTDWERLFQAAERVHWELVDDAVGADRFEGGVLATVADLLPDPATLFVSNSMPVRDLDRFARPRDDAITALANRGASGIDGITSTALGAGSATPDPLVLVVGDLAYYHDMNGLLAVGRCGVDATVVLLNNDGGGIFHKLPIEDFDPPFTEGFKTPHGLDFEPSGDLYDLEYQRFEDLTSLRTACRDSMGTTGGTVLECTFDAATSHRTRDRLEEALHDRLFE